MLPQYRSGITELEDENLSVSSSPSPEPIDTHDESLPQSKASGPTCPRIAVENNQGAGLSDSSFNQGYYDRFFVEERKLGRGLRGSVFLCQHVSLWGDTLL